MATRVDPTKTATIRSASAARRCTDGPSPVADLTVVRAQLNRNHVATLSGSARFLDAITLEIESAEATTRVRGERIPIASGTGPAHSPTVSLDGKRIVDSDQFLQGETLPRDLIVVGAGVIGLEYASMVSALNIKVTVIEARPRSWTSSTAR